MSGMVRSALVTILLAAWSVACATQGTTPAPASKASVPDSMASEFDVTDADGNNAIDVEEYRYRMLVVFTALDENGDGFIVLAEVPKDRKDVFPVVDLDGNGRVILREYMLYVMPRFWKADYDGNNVLTRPEVKAADARDVAS